MSKQLHKLLINYYSYVVELNRTWDCVINELVRPIESLKNQCEQLNFVIGITDNADICQMMWSREKLIFKINMGIDNEIAIITHHLRTLSNFCQELKNKFNHLQTLKNKISDCDSMMRNLVNGSSRRPQLCSLLESVKYVHDHYLHCYRIINKNYIALNRNNELTVQKLLSSLNSNNIERSKIMKSLAMTQFFIKETAI